MGEIETAQLGEVVRDLGLTMSKRYLGLDMDESQWHYHAWSCTLRYGKKRMTTEYRMGTGRTDEPSIEGVLFAIMSDAEAGERSFEEFCDELGYDSDSRKSERIWKACQAQSKKAHAFFGPEFRQVAEAAGEY